MLKLLRVKIVITGPFQSGKTTFIKLATKGQSIHVEHRGITVGLDFGTIKYDGMIVHLFGTPGLDRFSMLREIVAKGARGFILILDSTDPSSIMAGKEILKEILESNGYVPCVILANKQDLPNAIPIEKIKSLFTNFPVVPGVLIRGIGIKESLALLFSQMNKANIPILKQKTNIPVY